MADADGSYDLSAIPDFVAPLRAGMSWSRAAGSRPAEEGIAPGAMPWLHRWIGNPLLSWLIQRWFRSPVVDVHCGMRAFSRSAMKRLTCAVPEWNSRPR